MVAPEDINERVKQAIERAVSSMPSQDYMEAMLTHATRRASVHYKMADRLNSLAESTKKAYPYIPPELGLEIYNRWVLLVNSLEELGECLIEVGNDTQTIGDSYLNMLRDVSNALDGV